MSDLVDKPAQMTVGALHRILQGVPDHHVLGLAQAETVDHIQSLRQLGILPLWISATKPPPGTAWAGKPTETIALALVLVPDNGIGKSSGPSRLSAELHDKKVEIIKP
jgi:hypothetical protein